MDLTLIGYISILTLAVAIIFLKWKSNSILLFILFVNAFTEIVTSFKGVSVWIPNLYVYAHQMLWFYFLFKFFSYEKKMSAIFLFYTLFFIIDISLIERHSSFSSYSFIVGTFIYVLSFILLSSSFLEHEKFSLFQSNSYILAFSPVLFLLGMSIIFGFKEKYLNSIIITEGITLHTFGFVGPYLNSITIFRITLYTLINSPCNVIYYGLINLYIYKENKSHVHA